MKDEMIYVFIEGDVELPSYETLTKWAGGAKVSPFEFTGNKKYFDDQWWANVYNIKKVLVDVYGIDSCRLKFGLAFSGDKVPLLANLFLSEYTVHIVVDKNKATVDFCRNFGECSMTYLNDFHKKSSEHLWSGLLDSLGRDDQIISHFEDALINVNRLNFAVRERIGQKFQELSGYDGEIAW